MREERGPSSFATLVLRVAGRAVLFVVSRIVRTLLQRHVYEGSLKEGYRGFCEGHAQTHTHTHTHTQRERERERERGNGGRAKAMTISRRDETQI
jgi:hypothetical protein